eukprot:3531340-Amphidinium_carterae.1
MGFSAKLAMHPYDIAIAHACVFRNWKMPEAKLVAHCSSQACPHLGPPCLFLPPSHSRRVTYHAHQRKTCRFAETGEVGFQGSLALYNEGSEI